MDVMDEDEWKETWGPPEETWRDVGTDFRDAFGMVVDVDVDLDVDVGPLLVVGSLKIEEQEA
jgi:hypothetical protein